VTPTKHRLVTVISFGTLAIGIGFVLTILFWLVYPYDVVDINTLELLTTSAPQGSNLILRLDYTKHLPLPARVVRSFQDGIVFVTPTLESNIPTGDNVLIREVPVPESLPPGVYSLHTDMEFKVNPIRSVNVEYTTETFTVTPSGDTDLDPGH